MQDIHKYLAEDARYAMRDAITEAGGNEVMFAGRTNIDLVVESVKVMARGNSVEVPAIIAHCRPGDVVIHNHPSGDLTPSSADNRVASYLGNHEGVAFYIVNNAVEAIYVVVEPTPREEAVTLDAGDLGAFLENDGALAKKLDNYERRAPQIDMLAAVAEAFNQQKVALIEAGTGTGKTLAYLLPAIQWSLDSGKRVVVSTNTINLQQQLVEKDIPLLQEIFPEKFSAELVKGRTNYVCLRKLSEATSQPSLLDIDGAQTELQQLWEWANKTADGSKTDLGFIPSEKVWEYVQSESDTTLKNRCPFYAKCFFYKARRRAASADILVANHHLLFADLTVRAMTGDASEIAVLPKYERLILDEAHNLEDVASHYFGVRLSYHGILRILSRLYRIKENKPTGNLPFLIARVMQNSAKISDVDVASLTTLAEEKAIPQLINTQELLHQAMAQIFFWATKGQKPTFGEIKIRLNEEIRRNPSWHEAIAEIPLLLKSMQDLVGILYKIIDALDEISTSFVVEANSLHIDIKAQADRVLAAANEIRTVLLEDDAVNIRWIEVREGRFGNIVRLCTSPLEIAPIMKRTVFERFPTVVMTSATLSVGKSFAFISEQLGIDRLDAERRLEKILASPFDFQNQVILGIPSDIPEPNSPTFEQKLASLLYAAILTSRGRTFVLFTAYNLLNKLFAELQPQLQMVNLNLFKQGDENRHLLLNRFRTDISSVLFATDSFWEGVDVQGEALVQVIIPRLPFKVPSEPIIEARVEAIERRGGNSFFEYSVPQAVIKFKQGFGRLVRTRADYGAILVLDRRIISKSYGRLFLSSLPDCGVVVGPAAEVFNRIGEFLQNHPR